MKFKCLLALALGRTLAEIDDMPASEFIVWQAYALTEGLPSTRAEVIAAQGYAYVGATMGGKVKPKDLLPKDHREAPMKATFAVMRAQAKGRQIAAERRNNRKVKP